MKILLIFPPQFNPQNPYLSVPLLAGRLRKAGFETDILDLNIRFYNRILTKSHLSDCLNKAKVQYENLKAEIFAAYPDPLAAFPTLSQEEQTKLLKLKKLNGFLSSRQSELKREDYASSSSARYGENREYLTLTEVIDGVEDAVSVMKSEKDFYDPEKLFDAKMLLQEALKIASLPFAPNELIWDNYFGNPLYKMDWVNIEKQIKDESTNMFLDFFKEQVREIAGKHYDFIGISVPDLSQIIPAFTLTKLLKEHTDAHIAVGGNYITQCKKAIASHPELFGVYFDTVMTGDGEVAIMEMARYIDSRSDIAKVSGLIYKDKNGALKSGPQAPKLKMNESTYADFDGYDLKAYFSPHTVLPVQLGKGCYWGKCSFCDYYYGQQCFDIKTAAFAVDEMTYYQNKYGISHFIFIDEAIPPQYYFLLAREILDRKLKFYYYSFARLEKGFTPEVLKTMYLSGARILMWGYECASPRLLKMMNKGIEAERRLEIMKNAHEAGIWNNALFILGYPTETEAEIAATLDVIKSNREIINSCTPSNFALKKNSVLANQIGKNGVLEGIENGEFYSVYKDKIEGVSQEKRRDIRRGFHLEYITENKNRLWPVVYSDFDSILLYMAKYDLKWVSGYRSERDICPMFR